MRSAKIVATLGPASSGEETIGRLIERGADVFRLNLSHGSLDEHRRLLGRVRSAAAAAGRHVPVLMDLMGPRYRLGEVAGGARRLETGERISIGADPGSAELPVGDADLLRHLRPGERVLIDNGLVELEIEAGGEETVRARVMSGGSVASRKGINLPDSDLPFAISDRDRAGIALAVESEADFLGASYVGGADDLDALRRSMREAGGELPLVAKLERGRALEHLDEIVAAADAVMVARGDLGVEVPLHRVPVLQKRIIEAGRRLGRPVIVATQMLESMTERPRPTRAESSDVANAVLDGADALMLSGETAAGRYPEEAVATMHRIICEAEDFERERRSPESGTEPGSGRRPAPGPGSPPSEVSFAIADVVSAAAVYAGHHLGARHIVAFSQGGFTARMIARYRPRPPIVMFSNDPRVARRAQLVWGVKPMIMDVRLEHHEEVVQAVDARLRRAGLVEPGDLLVVLMGEPIGERPPTNLLRVHRVS